MAETPKKLKNLESTQYSSPKFSIPLPHQPKPPPSAACPASFPPWTHQNFPPQEHPLTSTTKKTQQKSTKQTPRKSTSRTPKKLTSQTPNSNRKFEKSKRKTGIEEPDAFYHASPGRFESKRIEQCTENVGKTKTRVSKKGNKFEEQRRNRGVPKKEVYYKKVSYDGGEFSVGDDVYVKRREDANWDEDDPEVEECRVCFRTGRALMIECDDCLGWL